MNMIYIGKFHNFVKNNFMSDKIDYGKNGTLTLLKIKNYINDNSFEDDDCILINKLNFDDLILEYRNTYDESAPIPFFYIGILVTDEHKGKEPILDRITTVKYNRNEIEGPDSFYRTGLNFNDLAPQDKTIYRCHNCGNIVDWNGKEFPFDIKSYKISLFVNFGNVIFTEIVKGRCCFP